MVKIFREINGEWGQIGDSIYGEGPVDFSGFSVELSTDGNRLAIGAPFNGNDWHWGGPGHIRIYEYNEDNNSWLKIGQDIDGLTSRDELGYSVNLSEDGSIVVGAGPRNSNNGTDYYHKLNEIGLYIVLPNLLHL